MNTVRSVFLGLFEVHGCFVHIGCLNVANLSFQVLSESGVFRCPPS